MRQDTGKVFRIEDYRPTEYFIPQTRLLFVLSPQETIVTAELEIERRDGTAPGTPLELDGDELECLGVEINGVAAADGSYEATVDKLTLHNPPQDKSFRLKVVTKLNPSRNSELMGLYVSKGVYCTQCEPEGFRRITYFIDRPDMLSVYTVRIEGDQTAAPLLLSNGNMVESGQLDGGRHFAVWHDPFPKPSYLFALVAGDLAGLKDEFITASGRKVALGIYVEHGKESRAAYAMDALKRSIKWDEEVFGLEYDLDVFNIVAVSDFNMGAMENKGLNIFNDKYVLADEATATDADFANIEAIIAHEYFHNWTGNRITCRDWFQLCLKEGLTVFRDHEFSADQRSRAVKRIAEVRTLRAHQFPEDQGPLAHPVRPRRYREINNFYTSTVYEKGSEVVRMIRTILGAEKFREGMSLYIKRHDGDAATIEDFLKAFEDASGVDLSQFALWYHQAGTPNLTISTAYDQQAKTYTLEIEQSVPPTPSESRKRPMHIPLAFGLVGPEGEDLQPTAVDGATVSNGVIHVKKRRHTVRFEGIPTRPALSLNRSFSAPVTISIEQRPDDLLFLARKDSDLFSRWQALNTLFTDALVQGFKAVRGQKQPQFGEGLVRAAGEIAVDDTLEPAFRALALTLPAEADIAREIGSNIDPDAIFVAREALMQTIATANVDGFAEIYNSFAESGPFRPDAESAGRRALRNTLLDYLSVAADSAEQAASQFAAATNMTDKSAALAILAHRFPNDERTAEALAKFEAEFGSDPLVMDKWYQIQATIPGSGAVERVKSLMEHKGFALSNPNRVRALVGSFSTLNQTGFHQEDGSGYRFFAETVLKIEKGNPQLAARLATAMRSWRSLEPVRREAAREALVAMAAPKDLSTDLRDIVERTLA
ncbi:MULTISPECIES: aminopeptidase N [unclassified Aminobacter]|uniref:aminopeptidase N n=1 Tax=unclassified Aminobacter TaxID=2644704 RepID=UPI00046704F5|nr:MULTISPECIES: aminopeptidase N [unclassified Aminobacter]TWG65245.1 aminopeptidase N [Aminobacter sp. J44]TWH35963.1 aminopeptidase N [Aminobacter sp. J15]